MTDFQRNIHHESHGVGPRGQQQFVRSDQQTKMSSGQEQTAGGTQISSRQFQQAGAEVTETITPLNQMGPGEITEQARQLGCEQEEARRQGQEFQRQRQQNQSIIQEKSQQLSQVETEAQHAAKGLNEAQARARKGQEKDIRKL